MWKKEASSGFGLWKIMVALKNSYFNNNFVGRMVHLCQKAHATKTKLISNIIIHYYLSTVYKTVFV